MVYQLPDHPVIHNMEMTGTPDGMPEKHTICPVCGEECETAYIRKTDGEPMGCDRCMEAADPWDYGEYVR